MRGLLASSESGAEELRDGCPGMSSSDGFAGDYSYATIDTTPDATRGSAAALRAGSGLTACTRAARLRIGLHRIHGRPITLVRVYVDHRLVLTRRGRSLTGVQIPALPGTGRHHIRVRVFSGGGSSRTVTRTVNGCAHPARRRTRGAGR